MRYKQILICDITDECQMYNLYECQLKHKIMIIPPLMNSVEILRLYNKRNDILENSQIC